MKVQNEKIVEVPTLRLTADETRAILRAQNGKINGWGCLGLVDLGILRRIVVNENTPAKREEAWAKAKSAVAAHNREAAVRALEHVRSMDRKEKEFAYELTPLGKQVARGIAVKLNAQYAK